METVYFTITDGDVDWNRDELQEKGVSIMAINQLEKNILSNQPAGVTTGVVEIDSTDDSPTVYNVSYE